MCSDMTNQYVLHKMLGLALLVCKDSVADVRKSAIKLKRGAPASMINGAIDLIIKDKKNWKKYLQEYFSTVDDYASAIDEILSIDNEAIGGMLIYNNVAYPVEFDTLIEKGSEITQELELKLVKCAAMTFAREFNLRSVSVRITLFSSRGFSGDAYPVSVVLKDYELDDEDDKDLIAYLKEHKPDEILYHTYD